METGVCLNQEEEPVLFLLQLNVDSVKAQSSVSLTVQMEEKSLSIKTEEIKSNQVVFKQHCRKRKRSRNQTSYSRPISKQHSDNPHYLCCVPGTTTVLWCLSLSEAHRQELVLSSTSLWWNHVHTQPVWCSDLHIYICLGRPRRSGRSSRSIL